VAGGWSLFGLRIRNPVKRGTRAGSPRARCKDPIARKEMPRRTGASASLAELDTEPNLDGKSYWLDPGSDRFFGDFRFRYETIFCAAGGTATAPLKMMDSASNFLS
jgi:hypothetical protein